MKNRLQLKWPLLILILCAQSVLADDSTPLALTANKTERLKQEDASVLLRHNPFYFAYGAHTSKMQLSFKSPIIKKVPLYFGYSQVLFWALREESKPFRDSTYNPELFYRLDIKNFGMLQAIDFGIWNHNSNGKSDPDSRSYEKSYIRFLAQKELKSWVVTGSVQFNYMHDFEAGNKDIQDYVGPTTFNFSLIQVFDGWIDKGEIALQATPGGKFSQDWDKGGYQLSYSFRLGGIEVVPAFYLQYYRGYAESLLNYNQRVNEFRAGVVF